MVRIRRGGNAAFRVRCLFIPGSKVNKRLIILFLFVKNNIVKGFSRGDSRNLFRLNTEMIMDYDIENFIVHIT